MIFLVDPTGPTKQGCTEKCLTKCTPNNIHPMYGIGPIEI